MELVQMKKVVQESLAQLSEFTLKSFYNLLYYILQLS